MVDANVQLRGYREATESLLCPGSCMSRTELAEAVNAHIWRTTGRRTNLDAHTIGRYERGVIRWPNADYRDGLRAVLGAATDGDIGFATASRSAVAS